MLQQSRCHRPNMKQKQQQQPSSKTNRSQTAFNIVSYRPIPHRVIISPRLPRLLLICIRISISKFPYESMLPRNIPGSDVAEVPVSPFLRLRLFLTSRERNTLYSSHPDTQLGPYSPLVAPRSNSARVSGAAFRQISRIAHRWRSGRMWCQKNGGRAFGSARTLSSRFEVSWFKRL